MAEDEASTATEDDADECLHCAIVDMVDERIAAGGADAANLAALIAESLVDPPVPINKTIRERQYKSMKRHLSSRGLTPHGLRGYCRWAHAGVGFAPWRS